MIYLETNRPTSNTNNLDMDIRKRSRVPRSMSSMHVVADKSKAKRKRIDIRVPDPLAPKKDDGEGGPDVGNKDKATGEVTPGEGGPKPFSVDFTQYSVGVSNSAQKNIKCKFHR